MKKIKLTSFLILLFIFILFTSVNLTAQTLKEISFEPINSINSSSFSIFNNRTLNTNNWSNDLFTSPFSFSSFGNSSLNLPISGFSLSTNIFNSSFSSFKLDANPLDLSISESNWSNNKLILPFSTPSLLTNRNDWSNTIFPYTNSTNSLWDWSATLPDWNNGLNNTDVNISPTVENDFNQLWKDISDAIENGLPKTAIELLKEMIPIAIESEKYGLAMKGICKQLVLEANIEGNKPEEKIIRLTEEIDKSPDLLKPLLKLVLAQWYWQYYQNNRWRFQERDTTVNIDDTDFTTWDLPKLFNKIDELYNEVLSQENQLKSMSMQIFTDFFEPGNLPLSYRPTLFDFAGHSAISFYQDGDQIRNMPEDAFELDADSDAYAPAEDFINFSPQTTDTSSPLLKAMNIYQRLLDFHINDSSKEAFVDADINRLIFIKAYSFGEEKSNNYITRLAEIAEAYSFMPLSNLAYYYWAQELYIQNDYEQAHEIAERGMVSHADSYGWKMCKNLITQIEAKEMSLTSEYSITPLYSEVRLDYKNITNVYFRVVEDQWDNFLEERYESPDSISDEKFSKLLNTTPLESWSVSLEPTEDYKTRQKSIEIPSLKPGYYRLIASWKNDFREENNAIRIVTFWVTEIAMITKSINGINEGFILDAHTGAPIEGAKVTAYQNNQGYYYVVDVSYTDKNGLFNISNYNQRNMILHAEYKNFELLSQSSYSWERGEEKENTNTVFFTDRSIYRPGQTIHFKVLAIKSNKSKDTYDFIPNTRLTITLRDYNYQEVKHLDLMTNAFGSTSGSFIAPSGKLTGQMTINCDQPSGSTSIRVEEYKRPKFKVMLDLPEEESRLDEEVELNGTALAYTGAPVNGAKVSYRVTREVRYPFWGWWYRYPYPSSSSREIAHGILNTDLEGKFNILFTAKPDRSIPESDDPTFIFNVSVDVTDSAGETRSASKRVNIGYVSMNLNISTSDWLTSDMPVKVDISATTLDQQPLNTSGNISVFKLKQPQRPIRSSIIGNPIYGYPIYDGREQIGGEIDESSWETWPEDLIVTSSKFETTEGEYQSSFNLEPGVYKVIVTANDSFDREVKSILPIMVLDPTSSNFIVPIPNLIKIKSTTLEVGDTLEAIWGTGYQEGYAYIEIEHRGEIVQKYWTNGQDTQQQINWVVGEEYRGGFYLHITHVHDNRAYISNERITVPWSNKDLDVSFSSFRSKLEPGSEETWTIQINGPEAENVAAELVATLYDSSLDAFLTHNWTGLENIFRQDYTMLTTNFSNRVSYPSSRTDNWNDVYSEYSSRTYARFPDDVIQNYGSPIYPIYYSYGGYGGLDYAQAIGGYPAPSVAIPENAANNMDDSLKMVDGEYEREASSGQSVTHDETSEDEIDLSLVSTRSNLNETAFFFPHLLTDGDGKVTITFTIPEALTSWKFMGFAHAKDLLWGMLSEEVITQKDFMVQPNPPRFLREGDILLFSTKITNVSDEEQNGIIQLSLIDTSNEQSLDNDFLNSSKDQSFSVPAKSSQSYFWELEVPDFSGILKYKVVASTGKLSDGEENVLPVLSSRIFVTESLPLPIRGPEIKTFAFDKLLESDQSETLVHQALTLQMVSNPAWYAVQSLPYLMEFPHECSEQIFNRLYANALAKNIANSDPDIKDVFDQWRETDALESNLEKNEELKSVILEETPWVRAAEDESESKKRVGELFDDEKVENSLSNAYDKLEQMQLSDGSWPWFSGGRSNFYITLYIMTGFGRLKHLNINVKQDLAVKCLDYVDKWIDETYNNIKKYDNLEQNNLSSTIAMYLYGRSFYSNDQPISNAYKEAVDYFLDQASIYWLDLSSRLSQGHLALACMRFNDPVTANKIIASLKERSVSDEEMGMFWRDLELSWWWYKAPIETQAVMIEAFDEVADDQAAVEDLKIWLLKQKQTQNWKTSKSTADAVYALLLRGRNLLASDELVRVTLGDLDIIPDDVEAGTGFYEKKFIKEEVLSDYGQITLEKVDEGIAWGSLHWQYMEDMSKVTPHQTPLQLEKYIYIEKQSNEGPVIEPIVGDLVVGDKIIVRVILRVDRDMEYVHMKDYRGSGTEPINVLSHYKYQDGLAYYESTKDTATHFFIDYLPKGTYVFEYPLRIQHSGEYQMGIATIQCMYAPEFNSHSDSQFITVN